MLCKCYVPPPCGSMLGILMSSGMGGLMHPGFRDLTP